MTKRADLHLCYSLETYMLNHPNKVNHSRAYLQSANTRVTVSDWVTLDTCGKSSFSWTLMGS